MFASKPVWYLPVALLVVTFLLYASVGLWFNEWVSGGLQPQRPDALVGILSPETLDALYEDARLHHALLSLTEAVAKTSTNLGDRYNLGGLESFGKNLTVELARIKVAQPRKRKKRGFLEDLGNLISGGGSGNDTQGQEQGDGGLLSGLGDLFGGGGNGTGGLGGLLQGGLSSLGDSIVGGLATPALFLGIGLGVGTETGLNLTDMDQSKAMATKVAQSFNAEPTGINLVAQNLGSGLTAQIAPALGNLTSSGGGGQIGMAAFALAQGIGQGTASGLNLTQQKFQPANSSDIMGIANNFGLGISTPIAGSIDTKKLFDQAGAGGGQLMAQIPQIAEAAGKGLGEGARDGLGLKTQGPTPFRKRQDPNQVDVPGAVGDFTRGLSQSFLQSADLTKLNISGGAGFDIMSMALPIASGAGKGIGSGAAISFGFKKDDGLPVMAGNMNKNQSTELIAQEFTQGLIASFLTNSTAISSLINATKQSGGGLTGSIQAPKVAEGAARGLVEGIVSAMSSVGGVKNLINGNFSMDAMMNVPVLPDTKFNDSVNGSAVAFARGLSGEGTILVANLIKQLSAPNNPNAPSRFKRSAETDEVGVVPYQPLTRRADAVPLAVDSNTLNGVAQLGVDKLTCQGIGGLASIAQGLRNSGTIKMNMGGSSVPLDDQTLAALPKEPIIIKSEGNKFQIRIQNGEITVNELNIQPFIALTALHVILTTFAFFYALPVYLAFGALWRLSVLIGHPFDEAKNKKWRKIILLGLFLPSSMLGIIFGIVAMGKAGHFRTVHGIFGFLALLFIIPTVVTSFMRLRTVVPLPGSDAFLGLKQIPKLLKSDKKIYLISAFFVQQSLAFGQIAFIQGFSDLRSISLCLVDAVLTAPAIVGLVSFILFLQVSSMALLGVRIWFEQRIAKKEASSDTEKDEKGDQKDLKRSDTMKTFGFDVTSSPNERSTKNTTELLGREDSKIGWPSNVRKFGEEDAIPGRVNSNANDNPFIDPTDQRGKRRTYNPKLGGYETNPNSEYEKNEIEDEQRYTQFRPSSDLDPDSRYVSYTPLQAGEEAQRMPIQRYESFSRPFAGKGGEANGRPSGEIRLKYSGLIRDGDSGQGNFFGYGR